MSEIAQTSVPAAEPAGPSDEPTKRVGPWFIASYTLAYMGIFLGLVTPIIVTMFLKLDAMDAGRAEVNLSLVLGSGALFALVGNPLFGKLSDRTTSRFGRRRPWLLAGVVGAIAGLAIVALAGNVWTVLAGWCLVQLSFNAALAALVAVLADQVPTNQRGTVGAFLGIGIPVASAIGTYLVASLPGIGLKLIGPALISAVLLLVFALTLKDKVITKAQVTQPYNLGEFARSFYVNPKKAPDFSWAWLGRFLLFMGLSYLLTQQAPYLKGHLHVVTGVAPLIATATLVQSVVLVVVSLSMGPLSDRLGRRKIFIFVSAVIYAIGLAFVAFAPDYSTFLVGMAITGVGQGVYMAVDLALVTDVLPSKETAARDLGVFNIASALPQSLAPAIAPAFLAIAGPGNWVSLFTVAAIFAASGAFAIIPIKKVR